MIAVPIAVVLFGYWVLYAGLKRASLADSWNCVPQQRQTAGDQSGFGISVQPGSITVTAGGTSARVTTDCTVRKGDTVIAIPGGGGTYRIWRPVCPYKGAPGFLCFTNGQLLGPCGG